MRLTLRARLGVEFDAIGLTAAKVSALQHALDGFYSVVDASEVVSRLRAVKSSAELCYVRRAAGLADQGLKEVTQQAIPGAFEGSLLATFHDVVFRGGGGYPANECILNSGEDSILVRHHAGRRCLERDDRLLAELTATYRRYHVGVLRTISTGKPSARQVSMHRACVDALHAAEDTLRPGERLGEVHDAQAAVLDRAGFAENRLHSCGYGLGATFPPTWVDWPMLYSGNYEPAEAGMTILLLMILLDREQKLGVGVGRSVLITPHGCESLSRLPLGLEVNY